MEDPADTVKLASAGGYPGKIFVSINLFFLLSSLSFLSVHVWTLVLGMLMSPDIGRNRLISKICYQIIFFFLSIDVLLKNKNIKIDKKEETNYHYNGTRSKQMKLRKFFFVFLFLITSG